MFEHMAFKGTPIVGSKDYAKEKEALEKVDEAYEALVAERRQGPRADADRVKELQAAFEEAARQATEWARSDEFTRIIEENGGTGLNAGTSMDATMYMSRLPSNRGEMWFYLESERFLHPVYREFYKERDVVREERRLRIESDPLGRLLESFLAASYHAHPYGRPGVGWAEDINNLSVEDAAAFFETYYGPNNLTVGIAGDVDLKQIRRWAEIYFGRLARRPPPPRVETKEPEQHGERRVELVSDAQPSNPDRLSKAVAPSSGPGRVRCDFERLEQRPHKLALQGIGSRQADRIVRRRVPEFSRQQVRLVVRVRCATRTRSRRWGS